MTEPQPGKTTADQTPNNPKAREQNQDENDLVLGMQALAAIKAGRGETEAAERLFAAADRIQPTEINPDQERNDDTTNLIMGNENLAFLKLSRGETENAQALLAAANESRKLLAEQNNGASPLLTAEQEEDLTDAIDATEAAMIQRIAQGNIQSAQALSTKLNRLRLTLEAKAFRPIITIDYDSAKADSANAKEAMELVKAQLEKQGIYLPRYDGQTGKKQHLPDQIQQLQQQYIIIFAGDQRKKDSQIKTEVEKRKPKVVSSTPAIDTQGPVDVQVSHPDEGGTNITLNSTVAETAKPTEPKTTDGSTETSVEANVPPNELLSKLVKQINAFLANSKILNDQAQASMVERYQTALNNLKPLVNTDSVSQINECQARLEAWKPNEETQESKVGAEGVTSNESDELAQETQADDDSERTTGVVSFASIKKMYDEKIGESLDYYLEHPNHLSAGQQADLIRKVKQLKEGLNMVAPEKVADMQKLINEATAKITELATKANIAQSI